MKFHIHFSGYILGALCILLLPSPWIFGLVMAVSVHELCHILVISAFRIPINAIHISSRGVELRTMPMEAHQQVICALAGPAGSFLVAFCCGYLPEAAVIAFFQGAYNLLPVYPLDGGRALRCIFPDAVCDGIEIFMIVVIWGAGVWALVSWNLGVIAIFPAFSLSVLRIQRKFPCKASKLAVQ